MLPYNQTIPTRCSDKWEPDEGALSPFWRFGDLEALRPKLSLERLAILGKSVEA